MVKVLMKYECMKYQPSAVKCVFAIICLGLFSLLLESWLLFVLPHGKNASEQLLLYKTEEPNSSAVSNLNAERSNSSKHICDFLNVKGIPKSGTTWLETTLKIIRDTVCNKSMAQSLFICHSNSSVNFWTKHRPTAHPKFLNKRWCHIVTFRDPRNRIISFFYTHRIKKTKTKFNAYVRWGFDKAINELLRWWHFFVKQEQKKPSLFFKYFYEHYLLDSFDIIQRMTSFIGLDNILNENDLKKISSLVEWENMSLYGYHSKRSQYSLLNSNRTKNSVCKFYEYMDVDLINFVNKKMIKIKENSMELFDILDAFCPII